jgi:hypothetical protein
LRRAGGSVSPPALSFLRRTLSPRWGQWTGVFVVVGLWVRSGGWAMESGEGAARVAGQDGQGGAFEQLEARIKTLEAEVAGMAGAAMSVLDQAIYRLTRGATVTREQVAAFFDVSTKKIQRLQTRGVLRPCTGLDGVLRYRASDVLRLASAK